MVDALRAVCVLATLSALVWFAANSKFHRKHYESRWTARRRTSPDSIPFRRCRAAPNATRGFVTWYGASELTKHARLQRNHAHFDAVVGLALSVHAHTCHQLVVVGIRPHGANATVDAALSRALAPYPRASLRIVPALTIRRRFNGDYHLHKLLAISEAGLEYGIYLDADSIVTPHVSVLWHILEAERARGGALPLLPLHPCDPSANDGSALYMRTIGAAKRTMPSLHANLILFPAIGFVRDALEFLSTSQPTVSARAAARLASDEPALNALLWRANATRFLCTADPFFEASRRARAAPVESTGWVGFYPEIPMLYAVAHGLRGRAQRHATALWLEQRSPAEYSRGAWRDSPSADGCLLDASTLPSLDFQRPCWGSKRTNRTL